MPRAKEFAWCRRWKPSPSSDSSSEEGEGEEEEELAVDNFPPDEGEKKEDELKADSSEESELFEFESSAAPVVEVAKKDSKAAKKAAKVSTKKEPKAEPSEKGPKTESPWEGTEGGSQSQG